MESFTEGYVTAFPYTYGYYPEMNPIRSVFPILRKGFAVPRFRRALELGFGEGVSINIHAAAGNIEWAGTDFNATQTSFARDLAEASEARVNLYNDSFAEFAARDDLGEFDFIGIHGIMSWISHENQMHLAKIIEKNLAVGGVLYNSYNTFPGWAPMIPMRNMLALHAEKLGNSDLLQGINDALAFAQKLVDLDGLYTRQQPVIKARLEGMQKHDHVYLAHEYFNKNWDTISFARMAELLAPAKMDYVCQANYLELVDILNLSREQIEFLATIRDVVLKESVRDFLMGAQFRRDYWVKGARKLSAIDRDDALRRQSFALTCRRDSVELTAKGVRSVVNLNADVYNPVLDIFADNQPHAIGETEEKLREKNVSLSQILEVVSILAGKGSLAPAQEYDGKIQRCCQSLNEHIELLARAENTMNYLACPLTGGGVAIDRFAQLFLLAMKNGLRKPEQWAKFAWDQLCRTRQKLVIDGKTLETDEENLAELQKRAESFERDRLAILRLAGIAK